MKIVQLALSSIKPYEGNPRNNEQAIPLVARSIQEFGFRNPIVVDKDKVIVCGHSRYYAAQDLGLKKVPCIVSDLPPEKAKAFRIADNKTSELATWNWEKLEQELAKVDDIDMEEAFGFFENGNANEEDFFTEDRKPSEPKEKEPEYCPCPHCGHMNKKP